MSFLQSILLIFFFWSSNKSFTSESEISRRDDSARNVVVELSILHNWAALLITSAASKTSIRRIGQCSRQILYVAPRNIWICGVHVTEVQLEQRKQEKKYSEQYQPFSTFKTAQGQKTLFYLNFYRFPTGSRNLETHSENSDTLQLLTDFSIRNHCWKVSSSVSRHIRVGLELP